MSKEPNDLSKYDLYVHEEGICAFKYSFNLYGQSLLNRRSYNSYKGALAAGERYLRKYIHPHHKG